MRVSDTTMADRDHGGRPRRVRDQGKRVRGLGDVVAANNSLIAQRNADVPPPATRSICILPDHEHGQRFIDWLIYDEEGVGHTIVMSDDKLFDKYLLMCRNDFIIPIPAKTLKSQLKKNELQVKVDRPIRKCPITGRALYLPTGSPDRWTRYKIHAPRKLPGKVPVTDCVKADPVLKPQKAAAKAQPGPAAEPEQYEMPMRRVA